MTLKLRSVVLLGATLLVVVAGAVATPAEQGQEMSPKKASKGLERLVRHELVMLPYYSVFANLEFKIEGYKVELRGQVTRPTLKSVAEAVVKRIEGVEGVVNNIEVLPVSMNDDRIRLAVFRAIYTQPVLQKYALRAVPPIHIIVKNGHVTLVGVVATEMEKNVAEVEARGVFGSFSVTNELRVEE